MNKYDSNGNLIKEISKKTNKENIGISVDRAWEIYQINTDSVFKYNSIGNFLSSMALPSLANVKYSYFSVDEDQNIYVEGNREHFYTAKINQNLVVETAFETTWQDPPNQHYVYSTPFAVVVSSKFGLFIAGQLEIYDTLNFNSSLTQVSVKYSSLPTEVKENEMKPNDFNLFQNYPNPFNPTTIIKYTIPNVRNENFRSVQLKVYDVLGKEVATLVNKEQLTGSYEVEFVANDLSSGIYFYKLQSGSFVETKKMILLR